LRQQDNAAGADPGAEFGDLSADPVPAEDQYDVTYQIGNGRPVERTIDNPEP